MVLAIHDVAVKLNNVQYRLDVTLPLTLDDSCQDVASEARKQFKKIGISIIKERFNSGKKRIEILHLGVALVDYSISNIKLK